MKKTQKQKVSERFLNNGFRQVLGVLLAVILVATTFFASQSKNVQAATPEYYTISYNANGGSGGPSDPNQYTSGSIVTILPASGVAREGFNFSGWGTSPDGGSIYQGGNALTITSNVTLYAIWTEKPASVKTYNLYYDANGGKGGPATERGFIYDQQVTVSFGKPTRAGDTFLYWTTQANGGGTKYGPGNTFTIHSETTLYAQWRSGAGAQTTTSKRSTVITSSSTPAPTTSSSQSSSSESSSSSISSEIISSETSLASSESVDSSISGGSSLNSSGVDVTTVTVLPPAELLVKLKELNVPTPFSIPLHNAGLAGTWSLFNLIAMIVTVVASVIVLAKLTAANKKPSYTSSLRTNVLSILSILLGPLTALIFLLLQQFSSLLVLFNSYSIWFGLFLILQIVFLVLLTKSKQNAPDEEDYDEYDLEEPESSDNMDDY